jgi:hypothetical protein
MDSHTLLWAVLILVTLLLLASLLLLALSLLLTSLLVFRLFFSLLLLLSMLLLLFLLWLVTLVPLLILASLHLLASLLLLALLLHLAFLPAVVSFPAVVCIPAVTTVACTSADAGLSLLLAYHEGFGTESPAFFSFMKGSKRNFQFFLFAEWNSEHFYLPQNGSELNSERFPFSQGDGIPTEKLKISTLLLFPWNNSFSRKIATFQSFLSLQSVRNFAFYMSRFH